MADPRFHARVGPFTLEELAHRSGAELAPGSDGNRRMVDVAALDQAQPDQISFLDNRRYTDQFRASNAGACVVKPDMAAQAPGGMALLLAADPYRSYAKVASAFYPVPSPEPGVSPRAFVDQSARIGEGCRIEPGAVIGAKADIGARTLIGPNAVIGPGVVIGQDCIVGAGTYVSHAVVGSRVYLYTGARIGQDGFGFAMGPQGHFRVPQLGRVLIGDDVEIGANTTVDRGAGPDTVIGAGCMIDNLVQIGHNVVLGRGCVLAGQVGIAGSTKVGDFVSMGGQSGIAGHLTIGSGVRIAAQGGVTQDIAPGLSVGGAPAVPIKEWLRQNALLRRLARENKR